MTENLSRVVARCKQDASLEGFVVELTHRAAAEVRREYAFEARDLLLAELIVVIARKVEALEPRREHRRLGHVLDHRDETRHAGWASAETKGDVPVLGLPDLARSSDAWTESLLSSLVERILTGEREQRLK